LTNKRRFPVKQQPGTTITTTTTCVIYRGDVVEDCKRLGQREKRLMNFFIRAAFHDSLSVDVSACDTEGGSIDDCGGADSRCML
jgi:hypothetical protein